MKTKTNDKNDTPCKENNTCKCNASDFVDHEDFDDDMLDYYHELQNANNDESSHDESFNTEPCVECREGFINMDDADIEFMELIQYIITRASKKSSKKIIKKMKKLIFESSHEIDYDKIEKMIKNERHIDRSISMEDLDIIVSNTDKIERNIANDVSDLSKKITAIHAHISSEIKSYRNEVNELNLKYNKMIELMTMLVQNQTTNEPASEDTTSKDSKKKESKKAKVRPTDDN